MNTEVTRLRNGKSPRSAAILPLGILFAMLGIAAAVVIWLSLTTEHVEIDKAGQGPKAVVELLPIAKTKDAKGHAAITIKDGSHKPPALGRTSYHPHRTLG